MIPIYCCRLLIAGIEGVGYRIYIVFETFCVFSIPKLQAMKKLIILSHRKRVT